MSNILENCVHSIQNGKHTVLGRVLKYLGTDPKFLQSKIILITGVGASTAGHIPSENFQITGRDLPQFEIKYSCFSSIQVLWALMLRNMKFGLFH